MSKALPGNNKTFDDVIDYDVFMTSSCVLGSIRVKKAENPIFFVFHPICLKFGMGVILRC